MFTPLAAFLAAEASGAIVLVGTTVIAMLWANAPGVASYQALWQTELAVRLGGQTVISLDLRHWVNDGLMALFFFVVGLEIKREIVDGELADRRKATLPVFAALGGMAVPAVLYLAFNMGGSGMRGWGIPIATDIAFALGALALVARGAPAALRLFLLSVAIADDVGSIVVIAFFYTNEVSLGAMAAALACLLGVVALWRVKAFWSDAPMAVVMLGAWAATYASGIHPTIAGVALGLLTPAARAPNPSPAERLEHTLHPWTSYVVIPLFALANAGIKIEMDGLATVVSSPITLGIVAGLALGKLLGVSAGAYVAVRAGLGALPTGVRWAHVVGVAALAGIGFTVSLFIAGLSFADDELTRHAKVGIVAGSLASALLGTILLRRSFVPERRDAAPVRRRVGS
ncbi:MAG: Na+/H+ antiporter NhaA [Chloroflexi bacterium]|nr:Na+/H+ antiporter NhaA [Chloroflexota bacterium]